MRLGSNDVLEITIRDFSRAKIESFIVNKNDVRRQKEIISTIKKKYGFFQFLKVEVDDNGNKEYLDITDFESRI